MFQGWASSRGHSSLEGGAFPTDIVEGKGLAGRPHYSAPQHPQNSLLLPLELCWSESGSFTIMPWKLEYVHSIRTKAKEKIILETAKYEDQGIL